MIPLTFSLNLAVIALGQDVYCMEKHKELILSNYHTTDANLLGLLYHWTHNWVFRKLNDICRRRQTLYWFLLVHVCKTMNALWGRSFFMQPTWTQLLCWHFASRLSEQIFTATHVPTYQSGQRFFVLSFFPQSQLGQCTSYVQLFHPLPHHKGPGQTEIRFQWGLTMVGLNTSFSAGTEVIDEEIFKGCKQIILSSGDGE